MLPIVLAVFLTDEVVEIHQEFRCGTSSGKHARHHEHHVDEAATERLEVGWCRGIATDRRSAADEPWIHGDGSTIVGERCLVVLIYKVVVKLVNVFICQLLAIHFLDAVGKQTAVQAYEIRLGKFTDKGGYVLVLHIGVGVVLGTCGSIGSIAIVCKELQLFEHLAVFVVLLAVDDERLGNLVVAFLHQRGFHLVLNVLHLDVFMDVEMTDNL